jgi:hypothetical protein
MSYLVLGIYMPPDTTAPGKLDFKFTEFETARNSLSD